MRRVGVLISGRGSNLQVLIDAQHSESFSGEIVIVISDKEEALGLERAQRAGIKTAVVTKRDYPTRQGHDKRVMGVLKEHQVDLVVLAGYMRILSSEFVRAFENRMINIHPSLLPSFKGVDAQQQAVAHGVRFSGCTTHFVSHDVDDGPIILQAVVPVMEDDSGESLAERILPREHEILVKSVQLFCQDRLRVEGRRVQILKG